MNNPTSDANRNGYDRWADAYDGYVNLTVAVDDLCFPPLWAHVKDMDVLEIGCGTGRHTLTALRVAPRPTSPIRKPARPCG